METTHSLPIRIYTHTATHPHRIEIITSYVQALIAMCADEETCHLFSCGYVLIYSAQQIFQLCNLECIRFGWAFDNYGENGGLSSNIRSWPMLRSQYSITSNTGRAAYIVPWSPGKGPSSATYIFWNMVEVVASAELKIKCRRAISNLED
jgi:hypothetical protein